MRGLRIGGIVSVIAAFSVIGIYTFLPDPAPLSTENPETSAYIQRKCVHDCPLKWTPLSDISFFVQRAVVLAEDASFFNHGPVSLPSLRQAFQRNLREGRIVWGGSTITMQLARNLYLYPDQTLKRKLLEILLAIKMEKALTKDRILEIYLNVAEWAPDVFGVNAAAHHYFSKLPKDLGPLEAAFLASILPGPQVAKEPVIRDRFSKKGAVIFDRLISPFLPQGRANTEEFASCPDKLDESEARLVDIILATLFGRFGSEIIVGDGALLSLDELLMGLNQEQQLFVQDLLVRIAAGRPSLPCRRSKYGQVAELRGWFQEEGPRTVRYWFPQAVFPAFQDLMAGAAEDGIPLLVRSAYRNDGYQTFLLLKEIRRQNYCMSAVKGIIEGPERSEHSCLDNPAIDFGAPDGSGASFSETRTFRWLEKHASDFGLYLSYPQDDPDGIGYEPWHWRFVAEKTFLVSDSSTKRF